MVVHSWSALPGVAFSVLTGRIVTQEKGFVPLSKLNNVLTPFYKNIVGLSYFYRWLLLTSCFIIYSRFCLGNLESSCYQYFSTGSENLRKSKALLINDNWIIIKIFPLVCFQELFADITKRQRKRFYEKKEKKNKSFKYWRSITEVLFSGVFLKLP